MLIDDRLLVDAILAPSRPPWARRRELFTTQYWYYRAARAAVAGAGGHLSGPFTALPAVEQARAIESLLALPEDVAVPDVRSVVPEMVEVSRRHARLNLMNVEAVAAARVLAADVLLSPRTAEGLLPPVLDAEGRSWSTAKPAVGP